LNSTGHDQARLATDEAGLSDDQRKLINGLLEAKVLLDALPNSWPGAPAHDANGAS
jgi:hypothetical protein